MYLIRFTNLGDMNTPGNNDPIAPLLTESIQLGHHIHQNVVLVGKVCENPSQHFMGRPVDYPFTLFLDLPDGTEVVVYLKSRPSHSGPVEVIGEVIPVNDPDSKKVDSSVVEYQILGESWHTPF